MKIYLDTSAFLKKFNREKYSDIIQKVFEKCREGRFKIIVSDWTLAESIAVFDRACHRDNIMTEEQLDDTIKDLLGLIYELKKADHLEIIKPDKETIEKSLGFVSLNHLSAGDALHATFAGMALSDYILLADRYFADRLKLKKEPMTQDEINQNPDYVLKAISLLEKNDIDFLKQLLN